MADVSSIPLTPAHLVAMAAGFLTVGYFLGRTHKPNNFATPRVSSAASAGENAGTGATPEKRRRRKEPLEVDRLAESYEDFKMVRYRIWLSFLCWCRRMRIFRVSVEFSILCIRHHNPLRTKKPILGLMFFSSFEEFVWKFLFVQNKIKLNEHMQCSSLHLVT